MTEPETDRTLQLPSNDPSTLDQVMRRMVGTISDADIARARQRIAALRISQPAAEPYELAGALIRRKCIDTGVVAILASAPALIPGIGSAVAMTAGLMVDVQKTMQMQKDLVLELAVVYEHELTTIDRRSLLMLIAGVDSGNKFVAKASSDVVAKVTAKLATKAGSRLLVKAVPFAGIATSAGINVVTTYLVGRRAQAYFQAPLAEPADWRESARALSGVDERQLAGWVLESLREAGAALGGSVRQVGNAAGSAGRSAGSFLQTQAGRLVSKLPRPGKGRRR